MVSFARVTSLLLGCNDRSTSLQNNYMSVELISVFLKLCERSVHSHQGNSLSKNGYHHQKGENKIDLF